MEEFKWPKLKSEFKKYGLRMVGTGVTYIDTKKVVKKARDNFMKMFKNIKW